MDAPIWRAVPCPCGDERCKMMIVLGGPPSMGPMNPEDAYLIAAAPQMKRALEKAEIELPMGSALEDVTQALAAARGEK